MRMRYLPVLTAAILGAGALASSPASASLIAAGSQLDFDGGTNPIGGPNDYSASTTGVKFTTDGTTVVGTSGTININNTNGGSFSAFSAALCPSSTSGGCGTIIDLLSYNAGSNTLITPPLPVTDFLTFTENGVTVTFDLLSFRTTSAQPSADNLGQLTLSGRGILDMTGFDPTPGIVTITMQGPGDTSFSGSVVAQAVQAVPVPEPMSILLLGGGLVGLGVVRRRRASLSA